MIDQLDFLGPAVDGDARFVVVVGNQHRDRVKLLPDEEAVAPFAFAVVRYVGVMRPVHSWVGRSRKNSAPKLAENPPPLMREAVGLARRWIAATSLRSCCSCGGCHSLE